MLNLQIKRSNGVTEKKFTYLHENRSRKLVQKGVIGGKTKEIHTIYIVRHKVILYANIQQKSEPLKILRNG